MKSNYKRTIFFTFLDCHKVIIRFYKKKITPNNFILFGQNKVGFFCTCQEMTKLREKEVALISEDRDNVKAELERIKSELTSRLKAAEDEVGLSLLHAKVQSVIIMRLYKCWEMS